jgi:hypothetical protein
MTEPTFYSLVDQEFFDLTKKLDIDDWREIRNEAYWLEKCPFTGDITTSSKSTRLVRIRYYVQHGVRQP